MPLGMKLKFNQSISKQIGFFTGLTLLLVLGVFSILIWFYTGNELPFYSLYILFAFLTFVTLLIPFVVWYVVHTFLHAPLEDLISGLKRAETGDFLYRVKADSQNEIGRLGRTFNHMMARMTDMMATQLDTERELDTTQRELSLKTEVARQSEVIRQTNQELQSRIKYLSLLYDIGNSINSIIEPDQLYQSLVRIVSDELGFEEFAILILDANSEALEVRACHGFPDDSIKTVKFRLGEGISGIVAQTGKRQLIRDTAKDPRYLHYKGQHQTDGSFLCLPLKVKGQVLGIFNLFRPKRNGFSAHEIRLLSAIANQAAVAIENAMLFNNARQLSVTDELTGVANRRHFKNMLELEKKRTQRFGKPMSILMADIDHFKKYNDSYGHLQGDVVLKRVAAILQNNIREVDLIARFGGEEFIVLLTNINGEKALEVAEKLREKVFLENFPGEEVLPNGKLTISVGCACAPDDTEDMDELENLADIALYEAKRTGKNRVVRYQNPNREQKPTPAPQVNLQ